MVRPHCRSVNKIIVKMADDERGRRPTMQVHAGAALFLPVGLKVS